jgi:hypothetical protein
MNEITVSVSRGMAPERQRLPLFRLNRRFVICCALCGATLQLALAETSPDRIWYVRAPAVPPSVNLVKSPLKPVITENARSLDWTASQIIKPRHVNDAGHRRDQFEVEFGIDGKRQGGMKGSLQLAKYTVDDVTFTVDDFTRSLSEALRFEYDGRGLHRVASSDQNPQHALPGPWADMPRGVRFSPELNLANGKPYVGLYVVVPFGN